MFTQYPDIIDVNDAMEILGVSRNTLYELIRSNTIRGFKLGKKIWRMKKIDLIEYIANK